MSLLLDALNKADQERKRNQATPGINSHHEHYGEGSGHNKMLIIIVAVTCLLILLAVIYWLGKYSNSPVVATPSTSTTSPSTASQTYSQASIPTATSSTEKKSVPAAPPATEPLKEVANSDSTEANVASLYEQNTQTQPANATLTISAPAATPHTENTGTALVTPTSINQFANLPDLHDLPNHVLEKIPSLNYSEHNYNSQGGSVKINGEIKHLNDQITQGVVIDKILEDGIILHIDNYVFKMKALNSWVNI